MSEYPGNIFASNNQTQDGKDIIYSLTESINQLKITISGASADMRRLESLLKKIGDKNEQI